MQARCVGVEWDETRCFIQSRNTKYWCVLLHRKDKRSNSGGPLTYISKDIPFSEVSIHICNDEIGCMSIELNIGEEKIMRLCINKNPRTDSVNFKQFFEATLEKISESNVISSFSLTNIIKDATCYKSSQPTFIDVMHSFSENTGIIDFHNLIGAVLRPHKPAPKIKYETVLSELSNV